MEEKKGIDPEMIMLNSEKKEMEDKLAKESNVISEPKIPLPNCRQILMVMCLLCFICIYAMRVNLSVAIVVMVNQSYVLEQQQIFDDAKIINNNSVVSDEVVCQAEAKNGTKAAIIDGPFNWSTKLQGLILGSFFYGYISIMFFGGVMAQKFGGKRLLLFSVSMSSILCIVTPGLTRWLDAPVIIIIRILQGCVQAISFPSAHALISKWAPPWERSKMITFTYAGCQLGTVIANPICGLLASFSWDSIFYLFGGLGLCWSVAWYFLISDSPSQHPRIHADEKAYIENAIGSSSGKKTSLKELPWKSIFTSVPLMATAVANFTNNWGFYTMLTCLPTYFSQILKFDIKSNGGLAALPYLAAWIFMTLGGFFADLLISKKIFSTTVVRKLAIMIGFLAPAACFIGAGYIECNTGAAVACIILAVGLGGISWAGWSVNHLDLAPAYAGTLMGLTNTFGTIPGFAGPAVAAAFTSGNQTRAAWRKVFFLSAGIYAVGTLIYCIFGSGVRQPWAEGKKNAKKTDEEKTFVNGPESK